MDPIIKNNIEIDVESGRCRAAFEANPDALSAWCCHHEILWEVRTEERWYNRILYIKVFKPRWEQALRFRNFRPCSQHELAEKLTNEYNAKRDSMWADYLTKRDSPTAAYEFAAYEFDRDPLWADCCAKRDLLLADYQAGMLALYKQDVPEGTWNGKSIFS